MIAFLKRAYVSLLAADRETPHVLDMIARALEAGRGLVVDVGCGYGRYLRPLKARGIEAIGVDVNPEIVKANRNAGLASMTPEEFLSSGTNARVLLLSHVIEHFPPRELLGFMDRWLDCLEEDGALVNSNSHIRSIMTHEHEPRSDYGRTSYAGVAFALARCAGSRCEACTVDHDA